MEDSNNTIRDILKEAENNLREMISKAAKDGDYRTVDMARGAAVEIKDLAARIENPSLKTSNKLHKETNRRTKKAVRSSKKKYPKFKVQNDSLIKIGWSKKQKREYTHKAPKDVFEKTVNTMNALSNSGTGPFMAEQIIEKVNSHQQEIIPSYQIYIVIGFLKKSGCIKQFGREGYNIKTNIKRKADFEWNDTITKCK